MSLVYWFSDGVGLNMAPVGQTPIATTLVRWIRTKGSPKLIVNGGDVYPAGKTKEFTEFFEQMDRNVQRMCETPGNHDWQDNPDLPGIGRIPHGYETFWKDQPKSRQPIDTNKGGGARYEHFIDLKGWRLIFLDTGDYDNNPWPGGDQARVNWLQNSLKPGRSNIICAHHSRLSRGAHGDNPQLDALWKTLFDAAGAPRVAFTLAGHDHNVNLYGPRPKDNPEGGSVPFAQGIYVLVNGAGGNGHYSSGPATSGTVPDLFRDDENYCVTRINLIDKKSVDVDVLNFGTDASTDPVPFPASLIQIRL